MLLSSAHFPILQRRRGKKDVRWSDSNRANHGNNYSIMLKLCRLTNDMIRLMLQLALTAASPVYRGYLSDVDCRWNVIAGSVDDRTEEERGIKVRFLHT
jgi:hypothetical protein